MGYPKGKLHPDYCAWKSEARWRWEDLGISAEAADDLRRRGCKYIKFDVGTLAGQTFEVE